MSWWLIVLMPLQTTSSATQLVWWMGSYIQVPQHLQSPACCRACRLYSRSALPIINSLMRRTSSHTCRHAFRYLCMCTLVSPLPHLALTLQPLLLWPVLSASQTGRWRHTWWVGLLLTNAPARRKSCFLATRGSCIATAWLFCPS